ncbi:hypothetical protein GCM10009547_48380 [Sporichthya brevicatena]|uniref:DUF3040 domain-containing protein n=1 Tax=Sporichthya brevicatena TaxID=171442 RepID=A0ABN1HCQ1_9ACTN
MSSKDEIDRLIAEADAALGRPAASPPARSRREPAPVADAAVERPPGRFETSLKVSAVSGGVAAALVFATFAVLPFLGAFSGAAGAFVATFAIVLGQRLFRRKT